MTPEYDPWDDVELSPEDTIDVYKNKKESEKDPWDELDFGEGFWKNAFRTALQIPQGIAEATKSGIATGLWALLGQGEALDPEEIDRIREISEREGIPFDEEAYINAAQEALSYVPTVHNIAKGIEENTGIPLEPKTKLQKALRLGSMAGKLQPGATSQKATAALAAPATAAGLEEVGVPEPFAELAGLVAGGGAGAATPAIDVSLTKTKPSGLPARQFENIKETKAIPEAKLQKINDKLEADFRRISDEIIKESPIGETAENLKNEPAFKQESRELLNQAQEIANSLPDTISTKSLKKELADISSNKVKGYALSEYDKSYLKFIKQAIDDILPEKASLGEMVEQYRKNNASLSEYFEPGASKALNRAKKDALLDHNRAIANIIEKSNPELSQVFKEGNARWSKIMDAEAVDNFIDDVFGEKISYKKMHDFFDKTGYDRIFKRALGEEGYKNFEQLMKDMLTSEKAYKMLRIAKDKGWEDLFKTGLGYVIHPKIGLVKGSLDAAKYAYKTLMNSMLDKPQLAVNFRKAIKDLKKGDFATAEKEFEALQGEIEILPKEGKKATEVPETIEVASEKTAEKPTREEPNKKNAVFKTEKGSSYELNEDGTTTRNKAYRKEHGEKEQGPQEKSEKTWFVSKENLDKLSEFQSQGGHSKRIIQLPDGKIGIMYESGKDSGKIEARTIIKPSEEPQIGLYPIESWEGGKKIHFGNKITEIKSTLSNEEPKRLEAPKKQIEHKAPEEKPKQAVEAEKPAVKKAEEKPKKEIKTRKKSSSLTEEKKAEKVEKPAASLTEEKVSQVKRQDISKKGLKEQKQYLIEKLDEAIEKAPEGYEEFGKKHKRPEEVKKQAEKYELLTFDVPGDGEFKIRNHKKALKAFRDSVEKRWPDKPLRLTKKQLH